MDYPRRQGPGYYSVPCAGGRQESISGAIPMKKQKATGKRAIKRIVVPKFASEAEEAEWWYKNRKAHSEEFLDAARRGEVQALTKEKLLARIAASKKKAAATMVSIRIPADDLALARKQADRKGLPYQTYIKSLLHETLAQRERKAG
jgi:predicted DNA binding CopG/RHH family protein